MAVVLCMAVGVVAFACGDYLLDCDSESVVMDETVRCKNLNVEVIDVKCRIWPYDI